MIRLHRDRFRVLTGFVFAVLLSGAFMNPDCSAQGNSERSFRAETYDFASILPEKEFKAIGNAIPAQTGGNSGKHRTLLVVTLNVRDGEIRGGHPSIPYTNYAIKMMGERTGAYETVFSNDIRVFERENLARFDAICFNNTVGVLFEDPTLRQNLLDFVASGKGFVGIHAAGATFCQYPVYDHFPEFGVMLGGFEDGGHPWGPEDTIVLKVDDPDHPVARAFNGKPFVVSDEVFQFREPDPRGRLRVLISIDTERTDVGPDRRILPQRRADMDIPISWVKPYGTGRVFYTSFGHNPHLNWNPTVLRHYMDGILFALGDLPADDTPSGKVTGTQERR
ncbi:ThuA domain-containing protein [Candidatus Latescibacterota bacterium]